MKHAGKTRRAGLKIIIWSFILLAALVLVSLAASVIGSFILAMTGGLFLLWVIFAVFAFNFFRDPDANVPPDSAIIVSPAHGTVDVIDEIQEDQFLAGPCRRISIFLSVFNVHVQNSPVAGRISFLKHCPGQFLNAMRTDCSSFNEHVLVGIDSSEAPGEKIGVRLIAGLLARRIIPWIALGDIVERGERLSLIQFGSRVDLLLPLTTKVQVKLGDKVVGGETPVATRT